MAETEFMIAKSMEECDMQVKELLDEKEHIERSQRAIDTKHSETNNLIEEAQKP